MIRFSSFRKSDLVATLAGSVISIPAVPENIIELLGKFVLAGTNLAPIPCSDAPLASLLIASRTSLTAST